MRKGLRIAKQAIYNTGVGEQTLYLVLIATGIFLIVVGWHADAHGWATSHPYATGLLDGATGFCFGIPVAGVLIRELTRRSGEATQRRLGVQEFISQLVYLDRLADGLSPGSTQDTGDWLRRLSKIAVSAAQVASTAATATARINIWIMSAGAIIVKPKVPKRAADGLRPVVEAAQLWPSVSFNCGRLINDATRLYPLLYPPPMRPDRRFFDLTSALETVRADQLADLKWLRAAVKDPPASVAVSAWSWTLPSMPLTGFIPTHHPITEKPESGTSPEEQALIEEKQRLCKDAQDRAEYELRQELNDLSDRLEALADLIQAAAAFRSLLTAPVADGGSKRDGLEIRVTNRPRWKNFDNLAYLVAFEAAITNNSDGPVDVCQMWLYPGPGDETELSKDADDTLESEYRDRLAAPVTARLHPGTILSSDSKVGLSVHKVLRGPVDGQPPQCFFVVMDAEGNTYTEPVPLS